MRRRPSIPPWLASMVRLALVSLALGGGLGPGRAWARRNGIASAGCAGCHTGGQPPTVSVTADPSNPALGQMVTLTVTVSQTAKISSSMWLI